MDHTLGTGENPVIIATQVTMRHVISKELNLDQLGRARSILL